jgi:hypothetical protein
MLIWMRQSRKSRTAAAAGFVVAWLFALAPAGASGLFEGMEGSWRGEGSIAWSTGETERMRCNAKYKVERDGNRIVQELTCATDSTRLVIKSTITYNPAAGAITGSWSETSYGINGSVTGTASTNSVKAMVKSRDNRFQARVTVVTSGSAQTVSIVPQGIDVTEVSVELKRAG